LDCDQCTYKDKRREGLSGHYAKVHKSKLDNRKDYSHFPKTVRTEMERNAISAPKRLEAYTAPPQNQGVIAITMATAETAAATYSPVLSILTKNYSFIHIIYVLETTKLRI
jgi:hypothetical protein